MSAEWHFKELRPGDKDRQPTQGEFFATDAIKSVAEALVRESIQNSLDAGPKMSGQPVRVRFYLGIGQHALPAHEAHKYFQDGWTHFTAEENGLDDVPEETESCSFLVTEDFGTTGLIGDLTQWKHAPGAKNPFYYFFRTEGRSGKSKDDRGRWGIGKYVFPRSSRISAFVTVTVRADDQQRLLMGQAVLKSHTVGNKYFTPDGDYGRPNDDGLIMPVGDETFIERFTRDFRIERRHEPGLSVVVPWIDSEITHEDLLSAVIEDYFFPILTGGLVVTVATGDGVIEVNKDSLRQASKTLGDEFAKKMVPLIDLADWARDQTKAEIVSLNPASPQRPFWTSNLIPHELVAELREKFRSGEKLAVEMPLTVRERGVSDRESFFRVYLVNDGSDDGAPVFIRDGIIISDVRGRWTAGVRSLVVVEHSALANLLGDSENPAHTQWQKDREHFRRKYLFGKSYIDFVTQAVAMFVRYLNESDDKPDRDLLSGIFSIPKRPQSDQPKEKARPRKRNKGEVITDVPIVEPRRRWFTLTKVGGGFTVTRGAPGAAVPALLDIAVAYDRRRGSPLKKYSSADFDLTEKPIAIKIDGGKTETQDKNRLVVSVTDATFHVSVTGFDENRDLFVNVTAKEAE
jgi:hypothetical protein